MTLRTHLASVWRKLAGPQPLAAAADTARRKTAALPSILTPYNPNRANHAQAHARQPA